LENIYKLENPSCLMKLSVDLKKNYSLIVGVLILILGVGVFVVAYGGGTPTVMGHTASEVDFQSVANDESTTQQLGNYIRGQVCRRNPQTAGGWLNCPPDTPEPPSSSNDYFYHCYDEGRSGGGCRILSPNDPRLEMSVLRIGVDHDLYGNYPSCWTVSNPNPPVTCQLWSASNGGFPPQYSFGRCLAQAEDYYNTLNINGQTGGWDLAYWEDTGESGYAPDCEEDQTSDKLELTFLRYTIPAP